MGVRYHKIERNKQNNIYLYMFPHLHTSYWNVVFLQKNWFTLFCVQLFASIHVCLQWTSKNWFATHEIRQNVQRKESEGNDDSKLRNWQMSCGILITLFDLHFVVRFYSSLQNFIFSLWLTVKCADPRLSTIHVYRNPYRCDGKLRQGYFTDL